MYVPEINDFMFIIILLFTSQNFELTRCVDIC